MSALISTLIDKQDSFEIVRDAVAAILKVESDNQVTLATTATNPEPDEWALRVFTERARPFEIYRDATTAVEVLVPIVNVWFDSANFSGKQGNPTERQQAEGIINIDCYGFGVNAETTEGHTPDDVVAVANMNRALRLVRNILMAGIYTYLQLRQDQGGEVGGRWVDSIRVFQPDIDPQKAPAVIGARIALRVDYNELSPQVTGQPLEIVGVTIRRTEDGEIVAEYQKDY